MRNSIRLLSVGVLSLGCSAAWSQTNVPGHVLDASNQLNNYGQRIYINNPTPQPTYGGSTRTGVYQGTNRWSSSYTTYPVHGDVYVNGMGPFPSSNLFPDRYSYELQAPLFTPSSTGDLMRRNDGVSAPVYVKDPVPGVPGYGSVGSAARGSSGSISPGPIDSRISNPNLADSARLSNSLSGPVSSSSISTTLSRGGDQTLACGTSAASEIVADVSGYALKNIDATLMGASVSHLRSNEVIGYIDLDKAEGHSYRVFKVDASEIWIPLGTSANVPFKAHIRGASAQDLDCVIK